MTAPPTPPTLYVPGDGDANDHSENGLTGTLGTLASLATSVKRSGTGSIVFNPSTFEPTNAKLEFTYDDAIHNIGKKPFTIEADIYIDELLPHGFTSQKIASHYLNTGDERSWHLGVFTNGSNHAIQYFASSDGKSVDGLSKSVSDFIGDVFAINTWYHIAWTRDENFVSRSFWDGKQAGSDNGSLTWSLHVSTSPVIRVSSFDSTPTSHPFSGYIDNFRMTIGEALYTAPFEVKAPTPSASPRTDKRWHDPAPLNWQHIPLEWSRKNAEVINGVMQGRTNNRGEVFLEPGTGETVLTDARIGEDSVILFQPLSPGARLEGSPHVTDQVEGSCTLVHSFDTRPRAYRYVVFS